MFNVHYITSLIFAAAGKDSTIYSLNLRAFEWSRLHTTGLDPMLLGAKLLFPVSACVSANSAPN